MTIIPEPGQMEAVAVKLMELADDPFSVRTVSHPAAGFEVPEELFNRFAAAYKPATSDVSAQASTEAPETSAEPAKKTRRKKSEDQ